MTETPVERLVLSLSGPTVVSMLASSFYNLTDTFFVNRLGIGAAGAVGVMFSVMALIQAIGFTLGTGAGTWISRLLGAKERERADRVASTALFWGVLTGVLFGAAGLAFLRPLVRLLGATETIAPFAEAYGFWIFLAAPLMILSFVLNNLLRAEGRAGYAMIGITVGGLLNILLDPLLIGTAGLGIAGAALATAIGQAVGTILLLLPFLRKKTVLRPRLRAVRIFTNTPIGILRFGMPSLFRQGLAGVATVFLNTAAARYTDTAVSAMAVTGKVFMVIFSICLGVGQGYMPVAGYNCAAGRQDRLRRAARFVWIVGQSVVLLFGVLIAVWAKPLVKLFLADAEAAAYGAEALRLSCIGLQFVPFGVLVNMTFHAVGRPGLASFTASLRQGIFFLPLIFLLPPLLGWHGVALAQPAADLLSAAHSLPLWLRFWHRLPKTAQKNTLSDRV